MATFASKKWGKQAFYCQECGYEFRKAWIEPMFMIRDFIRQDHEWYHHAATDENHPLVKAWTKWERERIIKLLEPEVTRHYDLGLDASAIYLEQTIELIKGEQE
jgi:hypothetical protein